jgi:peptidoglycan/LPS O-acetylase OafA/YrhL
VKGIDQRGDQGNSIGFLRLLLAAAVLYSHSYILGGFGAESFLSWSRGSLILGTIGVQGFFVLSGSLIATSWIRRASLGRFLWCRLLRLAPAIWVCLALTAFVIGPFLYFTTQGQHASYFSLSPSPAGYIARNALNPRAQISIGGLPTDTFWPGDLNGSLWTLFYEGACYLMIAALGLAGLLTIARKLGASLILCFLALYCLCALSVPLNWLHLHVGRLYDTPGKILTVYFMGGTLWALFPNLATSWVQKNSWPGLVSCGLLAASWHWEATRWLGPLIMPPAMFWLAARLPFAGLEHRVGDYSYGLYIYGYPIQQTLAHFGAHALGHSVYLSASLLIAGTLGALSWHFIEKPALRFKNVTVGEIFNTRFVGR